MLITFKRYEKKYLINETDLLLLLPEIKRRMTPDAYCTDGKRYPVYNIYFDNDTNDVIRHSVSKPYFKEKLRIRSYYQDPNSDDFVFLEIKKKIGKTVCKRRVIIKYHDAAAFIYKNEYPDTYDYMQMQILREIEYFIRVYNVKPAVYICYDRYAYFDNDNPEFRLTFDSNIRTRRDNLDFHYGTAGTSLLKEKEYLMEIKIAGAIPLWLTGLMSELAIFSTNFSKYGKEYAAYHEGSL